MTKQPRVPGMKQPEIVPIPIPAGPMLVDKRTCINGYQFQWAKSIDEVSPELGITSTNPDGTTYKPAALVISDGDGRQTVYPITDHHRQWLLEQLTGGIEIAKTIPGNGKSA